jgi:hypothetical protein
MYLPRVSKALNRETMNKENQVRSEIKLSSVSPVTPGKTIIVTIIENEMWKSIHFVCLYNGMSDSVSMSKSIYFAGGFVSSQYMEAATSKNTNEKQ